MLLSHKRMNAEIAALANKWAAILQGEAHKVINTHNSIDAFSAAMGAVAFYSARDGMGIDYDALPRQARAVEDMASDYQDAFGSPGIQIRRKMRPLKKKKPVAVTLETGKKIKVLERFDTVKEAEDFLATSATIDPDRLHAGHYGIDAPEEMVNPRRRKS